MLHNTKSGQSMNVIYFAISHSVAYRVPTPSNVRLTDAGGEIIRVLAMTEP